MGKATYRVARSRSSWRRLGHAGFTAAAVLLGSHGVGVAGPQKAPEDSVRALEWARAQALLHADTTALSRMVADEFIEVSRFGTLRTKADNIREIGSGTLKLTSVRYDSLTVRIYGEVAVVRGARRFRRTAGTAADP